MLASLSRVKQGLLILLAQNIPATFAFSFTFLFFQRQGYSLWWLIMMYVIYSTVGILIIIPIKAFYLRSFLLMSFVGYSLLALLLLINPAYAPIWYGILLSFPLIFFWIPLNYIFFKMSKKETHAVDSTVFMVLPGLISIIMPLIGAAMIKNVGYSWLFSIAALLFLFALPLIWTQIPEERISATIAEGISNFKTLRTITFLEGALHFFTAVIIPVYALLFFQRATQIGWFISYLAILSLSIALLVSRHSDKTQQRKGHLFLLFFLLTASIISLALVNSAVAWVTATGIFAVIYAISSPLRLAVSMDVKNITIDFWKTREIFLNAGRAVTLSLAAIFFYYEVYWPVFVMFACITTSYPFLVHYKLKGIK